MLISNEDAERAASALLNGEPHEDWIENQRDVELAERLNRQVSSGENTIDLFLVWDMHADSWSGLRSLTSIHLTLEGAEATIPSDIRTKTYTREPDKSYVKNYTYFAIEQRKVGV